MERHGARETDLVGTAEDEDFASSAPLHGLEPKTERVFEGVRSRLTSGALKGRLPKAGPKGRRSRCVAAAVLICNLQ
jgi:hypothetical protein